MNFIKFIIILANLFEYVLSDYYYHYVGLGLTNAFNSSYFINMTISKHKLLCINACNHDISCKTVVIIKYGNNRISCNTYNKIANITIDTYSQPTIDLYVKQKISIIFFNFLFLSILTFKMLNLIISAVSYDEDCSNAICDENVGLVCNSNFVCECKDNK